MKSLYTALYFSTQHAIEVQTRQLLAWEPRLSAACYSALVAECKTQNEKYLRLDVAAMREGGYGVFRGAALTAFVESWKQTA